MISRSPWMLSVVAFTLLCATACGGASPSTKKEMTEVAANAEPPPQVPDLVEAKGANVPDRAVSTEAKADFGQAVAYFQEQEKAAWKSDTCQIAADKFQSIASDHDKLVEAWFNAGVAYQKCGMNKEAEGMYKKAIGINPAHAPSLANLGEIYYRGGNDTVGRQYFEQAIKADAQVTAARNNLAWVLYTKIHRAASDAERKKYEDDALGNLSRVLAVDNDNIVAYTIMALIFMEGFEKNKSRLDMANLLLEEGKKRNDKFAPLYNARGLYYLKKANVGKALEQFRQAVSLDGDFVEARMNLAQIVLSFRKYEEAEQNFRHVLKLQSKNYEATNGLGVALRGLKKIDDAERSYNDAIQISAERGDAYYNLGLLWKDFRTNDADMGKNKAAYRKAKDYFQRYLAKSDAVGERRQDAQDNIEDCDKYVTALEQAIQLQEATPPAPPAPPPTPVPAPSGENTPPPAQPAVAAPASAATAPQ